MTPQERYERLLRRYGFRRPSFWSGFSDPFGQRVMTPNEQDEEEELTPEEWADLKEALGDALLPDGSVDVQRLKAVSRTVDLDELRREIKEGRDDEEG